MYSNGKENVTVIGPLIKNFGIFFLSGAICQFVYIGKYVTDLIMCFLQSELISVFLSRTCSKFQNCSHMGHLSIAGNLEDQDMQEHIMKMNKTLIFHIVDIGCFSYLAT